MNANEFASSLFEIMPSIDDLRKKGFESDGMISRYRSWYVCLPREFPVSYDNPVLDLIGRFDVSRVEVAGFSFDGDTKTIDDLCIFGHFETDPIALDLNSGEVLRFYYYDMSLVEHCAVDGGHFLDALLEVARFKVGLFDEKNIPKYLERVVASAGGLRYQSFYEELL